MYVYTPSTTLHPTAFPSGEIVQYYDFDVQPLATAPLYSLYREGEVIHRVDEDGTVLVTARVPRALLGRLKGRARVDVREVA